MEPCRSWNGRNPAASLQNQSKNKARSHNTGKIPYRITTILQNQTGAEPCQTTRYGTLLLHTALLNHKHKLSKAGALKLGSSARENALW